MAHSELFHERAEVQQEFLNTDAIYLTSYACLSLGLRGEETIEWVSKEGEAEKFYKRLVVLG